MNKYTNGKTYLILVSSMKTVVNITITLFMIVRNISNIVFIVYMYKC